MNTIRLGSFAIYIKKLNILLKNFYFHKFSSVPIFKCNFLIMLKFILVENGNTLVL